MKPEKDVTLYDQLTANSRSTVLLLALLLTSLLMRAEDGYDLWLRYKMVDDPKLLSGYKNTISGINITANSPTLLAVKEELTNGLKGLLGKTIPLQPALQHGAIVAGTASQLSFIKQ